jgi:ABC-type proline/glycine betaine transport system permease subunit
MLVAALLGALINLNGNGTYIHWGFIQLSVANFVVIVSMIVVFVLAILLPFPRRKGGDE